MTKHELLELRAKAVKAMEDIVEKRKDSMDAESLSAIKEFKSEIEGYDNQIEAIDEVRSVALKNSAPVEERKANKEVEIREAFESFLKNGENLSELRSMGLPTAKGGATVPDDFRKELLEVIKEYGVIYNDTKQITTENNGELTIPTIDDTANSGDWTDESGSITGKDAVTSSITLNAHKVTSRVDVSTELLEDSAFNMSSYLTSALGTRISRSIENAFIAGDGVKKPLGILNDSNTKEYTTDAIGIVEINDLRKAIFDLQPASRKGAVVYVSDDMLKEMTGWNGADGRPLLQASANATQANAVEYRVFGYPVKVNYELGSVATGENPVVIGNPQNYMVRNVRNITIKRSDDFKIDTDEVVFVASMRLDGKIVSANDSFVKITVQ